MKIKQFASAAAIVTLSLSLGACENMSRQDKATALGAGAGAVVGGALTGGSAAGVVGGAAVGGVVGNQVTKPTR